MREGRKDYEAIGLKSHVPGLAVLWLTLGEGRGSEKYDIVRVAWISRRQSADQFYAGFSRLGGEILAAV